MNNPEQKPSSELKLAVFLHIQKTAGTTIVNIARSAYGNDNIISHGDYLKGVSHAPLKHVFMTDQHMLNRFKSVSFLSGHFGYDFTKRYMQNRYSFTFLRDPVERVLSFYFFCKEQDPSLFEIYEICRRMKLDDFLLNGFNHPGIQPYIWNNQVWQLACGFGNFENLDASSFMPTELLDLAIHHIDEFSYIGITEEFERDRNDILNALGITVPDEKIFSNTTPDRPMFHDLSQSTQNLLLELTVLDQALYSEVCSRKRSIFKKQRTLHKI